MELMENGEWKRQTYVCLLQKEKENGHLFSLVGKRLSTIAVSTNVPIHANNHT
jgi:hypothetical protein